MWYRVSCNLNLWKTSRLKNNPVHNNLRNRHMSYCLLNIVLNNRCCLLHNFHSHFEAPSSSPIALHLYLYHKGRPFVKLEILLRWILKFIYHNYFWISVCSLGENKNKILEWKWISLPTKTSCKSTRFSISTDPLLLKFQSMVMFSEGNAKFWFLSINVSLRSSLCLRMTPFSS